MKTVYQYLDFYRDFLFNEWNTISPVKYGGLLIAIGLIGWLLMKSGPKRI